MKKLLFTFLLIIPLCKAADYQDVIAAGDYEGLITELVGSDRLPALATWFTSTTTSIRNDATFVDIRLNSHTVLAAITQHTYLLNYVQFIAFFKTFNSPQLRRLNLSNNHLGTIPFLSFPEMRCLYIDGNDLTAIPEMNLPKLEILNISWNRLRELSDMLTHCKKLKKLYLIKNQLSDFPSTLTHNKKLKELNLYSNCLTTLPKNLDFPKLSRLVLSSNQLSYIDPEILKKLPKLRELCLDANYLDEANVKALEAAADTHPYLRIYVGDQKELMGATIKGAKS